MDMRKQNLRNNHFDFVISVWVWKSRAKNLLMSWIWSVRKRGTVKNEFWNSWKETGVTAG